VTKRTRSIYREHITLESVPLYVYYVKATTARTFRNVAPPSIINMHSNEKAIQQYSENFITLIMPEGSTRKSCATAVRCSGFRV